ncbi:MAG: hypothetical protein NWE89_13915 [Candidatus Bathyarchaeota archaeon]|nr:hypothetical protein [Candidatus Bathyarchaeota archaeon]
MTIVSIDPQRRIYLPKELGFNAEKAIIIPRGETYLMIPVPKEITPIDTDLTTNELKKKAEEKAKRETRDANRI